ncbi:MAG: Ig-like domain repeat protein [Candidatus Jordarchaeales archaeon]
MTLYSIFFLLSILSSVKTSYGDPGASFTHIYVTHGNSVVDLVEGGTAKIYVGQTPEINLTAYNPDLGIFGADLYTKLNGVSSAKQFVWRGTSATWYWYWASPASQPGTYSHTAELWWDNGGTQVLQDTKTFSILVVELKISDWQYGQTAVQRGLTTPARLSVSFRNCGNDYMYNVKLEVIDTAGLNFQSQLDYLGSIAAGASKSSEFYVTAPATMPVGSYTVRFKISYDDFRGVTHIEEKTATVDVVNIATKLTLSHTPSITYGDTVQLTAYLYDANNNPIPSQTIRFLVNGTHMGTAVTDSSGKATYTITSTLNAGTYLIQADFQSTKDYDGSTTQPSTLLVQKMKTTISLLYVYGMKIGTEVQISAVLKDSRQNALPGQTVSFYLDNALIGSSVTDQTGTASIRYTPRTAGTYALKAVFSGSKNYEHSSTTSTVVIAAFSLIIVTPFANAPIVKINQNQFTTDDYCRVEIPVNPGKYTITVQEYYSISPGIRAQFVKWADGTQKTTITVDVSSDLTLSAQYKRQYLVSIVFRDATGTRTITPNSVTLVGPDGGSRTFTSYSSLWLDEGQWTVSNILWRGVSVELDAYKTLWINTPTELTVRCAIYDVSITVQDIFGFKIAGARVRMTLPNGDVNEQDTDQAGKVLFTSVPRGKFSVSVTNMGFTTSLDGDASVDNDLTVVIPVSSGTLIASILIIGILGGMAYLMMKRRRAEQASPPPPPPLII